MIQIREMIHTVKRCVRYQHVFLLCIVVLGIFLRTYQFHDWMVFNPDQARDAQIIENVISGRSPLPLLGPQSGNTRFALGPIFYYFAIISGKLFSATPDVFAYPDLLFSIFTIPLFYFFLRKYFEVKTALIVVAVLSVSYFSIRYGRFAWNPNSSPFFTILFLYGLVGMLGKKNTRNILWPTFVAIGLGVGIQLHTILFLVMPAIFFLTLIYLWRNKHVRMKSILFIVFIVAILNIGQIVNEFKTDASNTRAFFNGVSSQSAAKSLFVRNTGFIFTCQLVANVHMISSTIDVEDCGRGGISELSQEFLDNKQQKGVPFLNILLVLEVIVGIIFSMGGYVLLLRGIKKEQDEDKKIFLSIIGIFNLITFFVLVPVASEISLRYFIVLLPIPFILLGLWISFFGEKLKNKKVVAGLFLVVLFLTNITTDVETATRLRKHMANDVKNGIFDEIEPMATFILSVANGADSFYIDGNASYRQRYYAPLDYMTRKSGLHLIRVESYTPLSVGEKIIYITGGIKKQPPLSDEKNGTVVESIEDFNDIKIFVLRKT